MENVSMPQGTVGLLKPFSGLQLTSKLCCALDKGFIYLFIIPYESFLIYFCLFPHTSINMQ